MTAVVSRGHVVALLDVDRDLATGLDGSELARARHEAVALTLQLEPPSWDPDPIRAAAQGGWVGLFLIDGLMVRRVVVGNRSTCELFGRGDLIRPWDSDGEYDPLPIAVDWLVLVPTRIAVLDTAFALRTAKWPSINSQLIARVGQRARYLALTQAVTHLPLVHARLLIYFWLLAERWGHVGVEGVQVRLPLTHEVLAMLVGARRPTVTVALGRLAQSGLLVRQRRDQWLLTAKAIESLGAPDSIGLIGGEGPPTLTNGQS